MKKIKIVLIFLLIIVNSFSQDFLKNKLRSQLFSISPMSKKVTNVNGLAIGFGHIDNKNSIHQQINGLNLEVNPAPAVAALGGFMMLMYLPDIIKQNKKSKDTVQVSKEQKYKIENFNCTPNLKINGINISSGCFFVPTKMNGLNISTGNKFVNFNGVSLSPLGIISDNLNGLSVGIVNCNNNLKGFSLGIYNQSYKLNGIQLGIINMVNKSNGIQIGLYNKSIKKGFQLGLWNKNSKQSLPFINF